MKNRTQWMSWLFCIVSSIFALSSNGICEADLKIVLVVIDGVRDLEWRGLARDDSGKLVSAEEIFPNISNLKKHGLFLDEFHISNPYAFSYPGYADIFAGRRQKSIKENPKTRTPIYSESPTIFEVVKRGLGLDHNGVAIHASWEALCNLAVSQPVSEKNDFYRSCGFDYGLHKDRYYKSRSDETSRLDMDTFVELSAELKTRHPRFVMVHLLNADHEGHLHTKVWNKEKIKYGIFNYHNNLREDDYYVGRIWSQLQEDPFYKEKTLMIVTTDHGRDNLKDPNQWATHGLCVKKYGAKTPCSGCQHSFALFVGPHIAPEVISEEHSHVDLAPTIAELFGLRMPGTEGHSIRQVVRAIQQQ